LIRLECGGLHLDATSEDISSNNLIPERIFADLRFRPIAVYYSATDHRPLIGGFRTSLSGRDLSASYPKPVLVPLPSYRLEQVNISPYAENALTETGLENRAGRPFWQEVDVQPMDWTARYNFVRLQCYPLR
jgi:hypothetical protein